MPWGTYLNFQFIQGFFTERSCATWTTTSCSPAHKLLDEKITLQAAVMWETDQFRDIENNYGVVFTPELGFKPYDNIELALGYLGVFTKVAPGNSMTLGMYDDDQAYLKIKASF
jgi:hypothetical protein